MPVQSTKIYDRTGKVLLYEIYGEERREIVPLDEIADYLKEAVIATEDANFYKHHGVDFDGIFRAIKLDLKLGRPTYGGSTISQQLIRSTFLTTRKTIARKVREIVLTLELERRYSKDQILGWYLNQVPFGPNIYGAQSASKIYFGKQAKELSLSEAATLAALIKAPSYYSSRQNRDELLKRRNYVLDRMTAERYIDKEQAEKAKEEKLELNEKFRSIKAPHFVLYVENYLFKKYGKDFLEKGGFKIYTSINWDLQKEAEKIVKEGAEKNKAYNAYNAALVAIDPKTGQILAMVGSKDWYAEKPEGCDKKTGKCKFDPKVNVATYRIGRQPGSAFKPFVYATAFQNSYSDKDIVIDEKTDFGVWGGKHYIPRNYDGLFRGPVTLRQALAQSLNVPSIKVLVNMAGIAKSIDNARKFGITTLNEPDSFYGPSIVLGGGEVKLLDMVSAYGVFAADGLRVPPVSILKIEDSNGEIIEQAQAAPKRVLEERAARMINSILSDNNARAPMFGVFSPLYFPGYQVAAKTGTTNDFRDAWTIGYTPSIVVGVWAGNNNNESMIKKPSVMISTPIWHKFMEKALSMFPKENFTPPQE
ncbi:MAG TPA: PBP1A family penicillin-binding protein [Candidatus Parcubacteria bacterium]|nr:PBP1A family penicillin-binding protein [Candidatus Parcubacteria bacterium]